MLFPDKFYKMLISSAKAGGVEILRSTNGKHTNSEENIKIKHQKENET
jgi:hypothetical protein